jgi:hypothetical protein
MAQYPSCLGASGANGNYNVEHRQCPFHIGPLGPSVVIRDLRHRNITPQGWPHRELLDCLYKRLALVVRDDRPQVLKAFADDVDGSMGHRSLRKLPGNLFEGPIHDHRLARSKDNPDLWT